MMTSIIDFVFQENFDAALLFCEIDPSFYSCLGFQTMTSVNFSIDLASSYAQQTISATLRQSNAADLKYDVMPVKSEHIACFKRHHQRWLSRQSYGIERSETYWHYKLFRESYLHNFSSLNWPKLELIGYQIDQPDGGYSIIEQGGKTLRVLEVIGQADCQAKLWQGEHR